MSYAAQPLADLLARFAAGKPVPGGGPAAGIAAALGTSLVMMAATVATARSTAAEADGELAAAAARLRALHARLLTLADDDSVAYAAVLAAYRLPNGTAAEKDARTAAIGTAMEAATDAPLEMMRCCEQVLEEAVAVAGRATAGAKIDMAIGIELVDASLRGCAMCVEANTGVLRAADTARRFTLERERILAAAGEHLVRIRARRVSGH